MHEAWQVISPDDTVPYNWTNGWLAGDILNSCILFQKVQKYLAVLWQSVIITFLCQMEEKNTQEIDVFIVS